MQKKSSNKGFTKTPDALWEMEISAHAKLVFIALLKHGGKESSGIFPSWERLQKLTSLGRTSVYHAIKELEAKRMIRWIRGFAGRANTYDIMGQGVWISPGGGVDNSETTVRNTNADRSPCELSTVRNTNPNQTHLNQTHITTARAGILKPEEEAEAWKPRTREEIRRLAGLRDMPR